MQRQQRTGAAQGLVRSGRCSRVRCGTGNEARRSRIAAPSAISASRTTWPSRMPRTASATGSLWSSPSTRTVKNAVMCHRPPAVQAGPGSFQQAWQFANTRAGSRASPAARRRETDLALGQAEAGDAVQEQQDRLTLVAEVLGDGQGGVGRLAARERRGIGGRDNDDRAGEPGRAEIVLDELPHLASALADQREHGDIAGAYAAPASREASTCRCRSRRTGRSVAPAGRSRSSSGRARRDPAGRRAAPATAHRAVQRTCRNAGRPARARAGPAAARAGRSRAPATIRNRQRPSAGAAIGRWTSNTE